MNVYIGIVSAIGGFFAGWEIRAWIAKADMYARICAALETIAKKPTAAHRMYADIWRDDPSRGGSR